MFFFLILAVISVSCAGTWLLRRYALARSIIDVPNARSSHSVPTPRGGGVAIVISYLALLPVLVALDVVTAPLAIALGEGLLSLCWGFLTIMAISLHGGACWATSLQQDGGFFGWEGSLH